MKERKPTSQATETEQTQAWGARQISRELKVKRGRAYELAEQEGDLVKSLLLRHTDLLTMDQIHTIVTRESGAFVEKYLQRRMSGMENEDVSREPGMVVVLTTAGKELAMANCERYGYPIPEDQIMSGKNGTWIIEFPKGIYSMGGGGCQFYQEVTQYEHQSRQFHKPFLLGYDMVVRVESDAGDLWQNSQYDWDGNPKA